MRIRRSTSISLVLGLLAAALVTTVGNPAVRALPPPVEPPLAEVTFDLLGTYATGGGLATGEISAYEDDTLYVTHGAGIDVVDVSDPSAPTKTGMLSTAGPGRGEPTSVAVHDGLVAVAVPADPKTDPGEVLFFQGGVLVGVADVGALPDMVTFSPDGKHVLVANEGEPNSYGQPDSVDPEGSISVVDAKLHKKKPPKVRTISFTEFNLGGPRAGDLPAEVRIFGPGATVAQDLEPEYITALDHKTAYVTLQENNAVAEIKFNGAPRVERLIALGDKDHSAPGMGLDASDRDDGINIGPWPVNGMYMPDAIANFSVGGATYLVTANEGDARDYDGFAEEARADDVADLDLIPEAGDDAQLGRLTVTSAFPTPADGSALYSFGGRSFSIWSPDGTLVYDSGDELERITAAALPRNFNATNDNDDFDTRSDNKGPEPEAVTIGEVDGRMIAFVGLERIGGVVSFDVTDPTAPVFQQYLVNRVFDDVDPLGPDSGPEGLVFVPAGESPTGEPMLIVSNEVTGTVSMFGLSETDGAGILTLIHNNDGESTLQPFLQAGANVAGAAAYKSVMDREIQDARNQGYAVVAVYAGDAFLASATLACSLPPNPPDTPVFDAVAQRAMAYDTHVLGNHEFDFNPDFLERFIRAFDEEGHPSQPFLSSNLDFSGEPNYADLLDGDGVIMREAADGRVVAHTAVLVDETTGMRVGVVGATTWDLGSISTPRNVLLTSSDLASTATVVQDEVDGLVDLGINKIVLVSHLQNVLNDRALVNLLEGIDVAVAGGGDELLANPTTPLLPGSPAPAGSYPIVETDLNGGPVPIVTTEGNYKYVGRLDITFDAAGNATVVPNASFPRRVVVDDALSQGLGITDAVEPDPLVQRTAIDPVAACLADLDTPIARTEVPINVSNPANAGLGFTNGVRAGETNGGNLVTDSFLKAYDDYAVAAGLPPRGPGNPVIAVQNGGGIRQNAGSVLPVGATYNSGTDTYTGVPGSISRRNTLDVLAFFTNLMTVVNDVSPAELKEILEWSVSSLPAANGKFLQVAGLTVEYSTAGTAQLHSAPPAGEQAGSVTTPGTRIVNVTLSDGTLIVAGGVVAPGAPTVRIVTNSFTAGGGDNYPTFENTPGSDKVNLGLGYEQALLAYLLSFPESSGLPTIPSSDVRYTDPDGHGRYAAL